MLPIAIAWGVLVVSFGTAPETPPLFGIALVSISVYFLMLTVTASTRSESRAAMIGVLAILVCTIWAFLLE